MSSNLYRIINLRKPSIYAGFRGFIINQLSKIDAGGLAHNSIFRGANLGTISTLNEYLAFRTAHGIDDNTYKDLYIGDFFTIQDGTYNIVWIVAHFNYYDRIVNAPRGVTLFAVRKSDSNQITGKMKDTNDTTGGYAATIPHTTTLPALATALQTVLGSYLVDIPVLISNSTNATALSMSGADNYGAATDWEWVLSGCKAVLPNEIQIYGSMICSSSLFDAGEANEKLALFNFINQNAFGKYSFWLRSVSHSAAFVVGYDNGYSTKAGSTTSYALRPLIYIN